MDWVKRILGITVALFCILLVAGVGQFCLEIDLKWYSALIKPTFMPSAFGFTVLVSLVYACCVAVISGLVVHKRFFPSFVLLAGTGVLAVIFLFAVFRLKSLYGGAAVMLALFLLSFAVEARFAAEERSVALAYLPVLVFNGFCLVLSFTLALSN